MLTRFFKKSLILSGLMLLSQSKASAQVGVSDNYFQSKYPTFAVLGDSFIEGDILSSNLREMLQKRYASSGGADWSSRTASRW